MSITAVPLRPVKRRVLVILWVGILLALVVAGVAAWAGTHAANSDFFVENRTVKGVVETPSGLQYQILTPGQGAAPTDTDVVLVNYTGKLLDGTVFDQSQRPTPFPVTGVVPGFSEGLKLMPKGSKYRLWIKPELGYGAAAQGDAIPANSVLVFDVEMLDFLPEAVIQQMQQQQQQQGGVPGGPGAPPPGGPGQP